MQLGMEDDLRSWGETFSNILMSFNYNKCVKNECDAY